MPGIAVEPGQTSHKSQTVRRLTEATGVVAGVTLVAIGLVSQNFLVVGAGGGVFAALGLERGKKWLNVRREQQNSLLDVSEGQEAQPTEAELAYREDVSAAVARAQAAYSSAQKTVFKLAQQPERVEGAIKKWKRIGKIARTAEKNASGSMKPGTLASVQELARQAESILSKIEGD